MEPMTMMAIGSGVGGLLGGLGSKKKTATTTQGLPPWLMPYYTGAAKDAQGLYQGAQFTPSSGATMQGAQELIGFDPLASQGAQGLAQRTLAGDYLSPDSNPWLKQTFNSGADAIQARLGSQFGGAGRFNSGAMVGASGQALTDLAGDIYGGNYQAERARQMQAAGMAPGLDRGVMQGAQAQLMGGGILDEEALRKANFGWENLDRYTNQLSRISSPFSVQSTPMARNRGAGILGGALAGAQLFSNFGGFGGGGGGTPAPGFGFTGADYAGPLYGGG